MHQLTTIRAMLMTDTWHGDGIAWVGRGANIKGINEQSNGFS
jgi:hypothetical protein